MQCDRFVDEAANNGSRCDVSFPVILLAATQQSATTNSDIALALDPTLQITRYRLGKLIGTLGFWLSRLFELFENIRLPAFLHIPVAVKGG
jgi:hypothetical protein